MMFVTVIGERLDCSDSSLRVIVFAVQMSCKSNARLFFLIPIELIPLFFICSPVRGVYPTRGYTRKIICTQQKQIQRTAKRRPLSLSKKSLGLLRVATLNPYIPAAAVYPAQRIARFGRFLCAFCRP
jgi:hypothetical protein